MVQNLETVKTLMAKHNERSTVRIFFYLKSIDVYLPNGSSFQVQALNTGSSTVVLVKEMGLMLELPRILLNMYQVSREVLFSSSI